MPGLNRRPLELEAIAQPTVPLPQKQSFYRQYLLAARDAKTIVVLIYCTKFHMYQLTMLYRELNLLQSLMFQSIVPQALHSTDIVGFNGPFPAFFFIFVFLKMF